jgi:outer membrane receptor protein involved in Fe transport
VNKYIKYSVLGAALALLNTFAYAQTVEEVTVTAARKEQSVQDVAISVQAITNDDLTDQHIDTADDLKSAVPGFDFTEALGGGVGLKIRGLAFATIGSAGTAPAITAQNGHQIGNRVFSTTGFYDADRIEILEGPQGSLYGRNSTTGLINFITAKPGADQYVTLSAGADGLSQLKFARDFDFGDGASMRLAGVKYDKDGVVYNAGTGNDIDGRDTYGIRSTFEFLMDDQNTLTFQYEKLSVNDTRQNYGLSACNRDAFFGCNPLTESFVPHLNRPVLVSGSVSNTFNALTDINASGADLFAATDAARVNSIDSINKDVDPTRTENFEMGAITNVTELDDMTITLKATHINSAYEHTTDNDHSNATGALNGTFIPAPAFSIPTLRTVCFGDLKNVTTDRAFECTDLSGTSQQYEVNIVSDFDGPFNFVAGAYNYLDTLYSEYTIQTTAYLLLNDFDQHPYSPLFGGTLDDYGGQAFYSTFGATLAASAADITAAIQTGVGNGLTQAQALGAYLTTTVGPAIRATAACGAGLCTKDMPREAGGLISDQRTQRNSQAVYGEFYWDINDSLKLTLGGRYMDDRFSTRTLQGLSDTAYTGGAACSTTDYQACYDQGSTFASNKNEESTYKFALQYDYDQGMVYTSYVTGVRPSGANPDATIYKESKSTQIEVGTRNVLLGGALRVNATFFSQEVEDSQQSIIRFSAAYVEPHDMTHEGLSLNVQGFVTPSTILSVNALVTDSTFDKKEATTANTTASAILGYAFASGSTSLEPQNPTQSTSFNNLTRTQAAAIATGNPAAPTVDAALQAICGGLPAAVAALCATVNYSVDSHGNYLINPFGEVYAIANASFAPINQVQGFGTYNQFVEIGGNKVPGTADLETTVTLTQLYQFGGGSGSFNLSYHYKDLTFGDIYNLSRFATPDREYFNLNATYEPNNADWYLNLWARNLADKRHINSISKNSNLQGGNPFLTFDEGRKLGLDFGYNF